MKGFHHNEEELFRQERDIMVRRQLAARGIRDSAVLTAMLNIPRHLFVPPNNISEAYADRALPIHAGQTISQPFIVAYMLQALQLNATDRVLEIGTGSGYAAALLSQLASEVYTIERIPELALEARERIQTLGFTNTHVYLDDGSIGLPSQAPFDAILVSAAAPQVPQPLREQLAEGGRMVIPVGGRNEQVLMGITYNKQHYTSKTLCAVRFVPLLGLHAWEINQSSDHS